MGWYELKAVLLEQEGTDETSGHGYLVATLEQSEEDGSMAEIDTMGVDDVESFEKFVRGQLASPVCSPVPEWACLQLWSLCTHCACS